MSTASRRKPCGRCGSDALVGWHWPDGFVCVSCVRHAARRRGACPVCGQERALPGQDRLGRTVCVDCAGITTSFFCTTCGSEGELWFARTCLRCSLRRRLAEVLDDGTGRIAPALSPLFEALSAMAEPRSGLTWLQARAVRERLGAIATGTVSLSHDGIDRLAPGQGREYLRELLMVHGLLPPRDKHLLAFERWEAACIEGVEDPEDRRLIRIYLRWRHHRELTARAAAGPLSASVVAAARKRTRAGLRLLGWMRARNTELAECRQADLDAWFSSVSNPWEANDFLGWAIRHRHCPRLTVPRPQRPCPPATSQEQRNRLLARLLSDDSIELADRVAGCLVLTLAQPVSRVSTLRLAGIEERDGEAWLRLGNDPVPLPDPIGTLVLALTGQRRNMATAANLTSPWLFPGHRPGQAISPTQLGHRLARLGVTRLSRQAAFYDLLATVPAPVLARSLGYNPQTTARKADELGTDWNSYAALKARQTTSP